MSNFESLYQARYGRPDVAVPAAGTAIIEHLLQHRSVRAYLDKPVGDDTLAAIVAAAQSASSSSNLQAWSLVAVREPETRARLAELCGGQAHVEHAPLQLMWLADLARLERVAEALGRPHAALDYTEMLLVGVIDAALAAQNAVTAAESLGLATVFIGGMRNHPEQVAELLGLPPKVVAVFGMCVGYPDPAKPASIKPRLPQEVVLHQERYELAAQDAGVEAYNGAMADFYKRENMQVHGTWAIHSSKRVAGPNSLSGRDRLVEALKQLGFEMR